MSDTNYIAAIVRILEKPEQKTFSDNILITKFRAQLPQIRNKTIITLTFWGNLARDVFNYYKINDYIIIEGYLSVRNKQLINLKARTSSKSEITVLKAYPFLLNSKDLNRPF
jgi:single-stranded DNA-binding protein